MILDNMPLHPLWKVSTKALNWLKIIKVFNTNNDDKQEVLYNASVFLSLYPSSFLWQCPHLFPLKLQVQNLFSSRVCSLLFQPLLHPFLCNFYQRFINLSYGSPCHGLVLSENCFFHLENLFHLSPFRHTHLPVFLLALCNTMSLVCIRNLCEPFNFVTRILWSFLYYLSFLPFFS